MKTNDKIQETGNTKVISTDCPIISADCSKEPLMKFLATLGYTERALWLSEYGEAICKYDLYRCIENSHAICSSKFEDMAREHDENRTATIVKLYSLSWKELEDFIKNENLYCYIGYIAFDLSGNTAKPRKTPYTLNETTYSVPLFEGIKKVQGNINTIYFAKAIVPFKEKEGIVNRERIIFKIENTSGKFFHYDISDDPAYM